MQDAEQEVERAEPPHSQLAKGDHSLVGGEQVQDGILPGQQRRAGAKGVHHPDANGHPHRALYPVQTPCAVVLPHKGGGGHADAADRQNVEAVDLHVGRKARHSGRTVAVHAGLHQHVGKGDDHVLDAGRQTHPDDAAGHFAVQPDGGKLHPAGILAFHQKAQAQYAGNQLAQVGGNGSARHAHPQPYDEHKVQHDIGHRRPCQIHQRAAGVAGGVQDAGGHVIHHAEQHPAKVDADIGHGIGQHLGGGVHGHQQSPPAGNAAHRQQKPHDHRNGKGGVHRLAGLPAITRAQILRYHHARAHGKPLTEADEQVDGRPAGAHGGKGVAAHKIAHDDAVGGVVHLLQQVAEDQRQGEQQQTFYNAALGHKGSGVPGLYGGHGVAPPLSVKNRL